MSVQTETSVAGGPAAMGASAGAVDLFEQLQLRPQWGAGRGVAAGHTRTTGQGVVRTGDGGSRAALLAADGESGRAAVRPDQAPMPRRGLFLGFGGAPELFLDLDSAAAYAYDGAASAGRGSSDSAPHGLASALFEAVEDLANAASRLRLPGSASNPVPPSPRPRRLKLTGGAAGSLSNSASADGQNPPPRRGFQICLALDLSPASAAVRRACLRTDIETFAQVACAAGVGLNGGELDAAWLKRYERYREETEPCPVAESARRAQEREEAGRGRPVRLDLSVPAVPELRLSDAPQKTPYDDPDDLKLGAFGTTHFAASYDVQRRPHVILMAKHGSSDGAALELRGSYYDLPPELRAELFGAAAAVVRRFANDCGAQRAEIQIHFGGWRTQGEFHLHVILEPDAYVDSFARVARLPKLEREYPISGSGRREPWRTEFDGPGGYLEQSRAQVAGYLKREREGRLLEWAWLRASGAAAAAV